ncbi:hypothetical protein L9F63_011135, partial [Diploptera punctata]
ANSRQNHLECQYSGIYIMLFSSSNILHPLSLLRSHDGRFLRRIADRNRLNETMIAYNRPFELSLSGWIVFEDQLG